MPSCELCGKETSSIVKAKIEGAKLDVCESCADMGETIDTPEKKMKKKKKSRPRENEVLVDDYGKQVKQARESEEISIKELADELNEKSSLISKIEKQDLKPDRTLAQKLSKRLGVELYTNPEVMDYDSGSNADSRKATLEDVAEVD